MKMLKWGMHGQNKLAEFAVAIMLAALFVLPFFSFASQKKNLYVDIKATGQENGTPALPFHSIKAALQAAGGEADVHVARGTYRENIVIPSDVRLFGEDREAVVIEAADNDKAAVLMQDETKIDKVTVRFGKTGIKIEGEGKISVVDVIVEKSEHDGISVDDAKVNKKNLVGITDSIIRNNERAGIFSEKRKLSLINNEITDNEKDGVVLQRGVSAWIKGNEFEDNDGVGLRVELDRADVWTIKNSYKKNEKGGVMVDAFGKSGRVDIARSRFTDNGGYGIVRLAHSGAIGRVWNGLTINSNNTFKDSNKGNLSPIIVK